MSKRNRVFLGIFCLTLFVFSGAALSGLSSATCPQTPTSYSSQGSESYQTGNHVSQTTSVRSPSRARKESEEELPDSFTLATTPHDPILIVNNTDFANQAADEGWQGNGQSGSPYIIEGYLISSVVKYGIQIRNTNVNFTIQDCEVLNCKHDAIYLDNVTNGELYGNLCHDNQAYGIEFLACKHLVISGNTIYNNHYSGILASELSGFVERSIDILENTITDNLFYGIEGCTSNSVISDNAISNNSVGIYLYSATTTHVVGNNITLSPDAGIFLRNCWDCNIEHNTISKTGGFGICLDYSDSNTIINNVLWNCGFGYFTPSAEVSHHKQTLVDNNLVNGEPLVFFQDEPDLLIDDLTPAGQIILLNCSMAHIMHKELSNCTAGLYAQDCANITLEDLVCTNNSAYGMAIDSSPNASIKGCDISRNVGYTGGGFYQFALYTTCIVSGSSGATIVDSTFSENGEGGLSCSGGSLLTVEGCVMNDNGFQGLSAYSENSSFIGNTACGNSQNGIDSSGSSCNISENNACGNGGDGLQISGYYSTISENNASDNLGCGISVSGDFIHITQNAVSNNTVSGIEFTGTHNTAIDNVLLNNALGIKVLSSFNLVCNNTIDEQLSHGFCVDIESSGDWPNIIDSVNNTFTWNDFFVYETHDPYLDVLCFSGLGMNLTAEYNYYSFYHGTDENQDGIGDSAITWRPGDPYPVMLPMGSVPVFLEPPVNQVAAAGILNYDMNATARPPGVDHWWINDTVHFSISSYGVLTNASALSPGTYGLEVRVYDHEGRFASARISIVVPAPSTPTTTTSPGLFSPQDLMLIAGIIGVAVAVVLVVSYTRKRTKP